MLQRFMGGALCRVWKSEVVHPIIISKSYIEIDTKQFELFELHC